MKSPMTLPKYKARERSCNAEWINKLKGDPVLDECQTEKGPMTVVMYETPERSWNTERTDEGQ